MMPRQLILVLLILMGASGAGAQIPKLYINIVSHNEPGDNLHQPLNFNKSVAWVQQFADLMDLKNAAWNLETCDGFVNGALNIQSGGTMGNDILETLASPPYDDNIEIDPRNKNLPGSNIADLWHLLDSCGANPSRNLGGFIYASTQPTPPDWFQYQDTIWGNVYTNVPWKCNIIWGAGSLPAHDNDLNDYGMWKPDTTTNFYTHNPARSVWYQGNGCQPINALDSLEDEQIVINQIKGAVDSIQNVLWPSRLFYCYTVVINQSQFGQTLYRKIGNVIDSVNAIGSSKIEWATISRKYDAFQIWQGAPEDYSQWYCGQTEVGVESPMPSGLPMAYPNPFQRTLKLQHADATAHDIVVHDAMGRLVFHQMMTAGEAIDASKWGPGMYVVVVDGQNVRRVVKQ